MTLNKLKTEGNATLNDKQEAILKQRFREESGFLTTYEVEIHQGNISINHLKDGEILISGSISNILGSLSKKLNNGSELVSSNHRKSAEITQIVIKDEDIKKFEVTFL